MQLWEHTTAAVGGHDENAMGLQGWELVAVDAGIAFYKRALAVLGLSEAQLPAAPPPPPVEAPVVPAPPVEEAAPPVAMPTGDEAVTDAPAADTAEQPEPIPAEEPQTAA